MTELSLLAPGRALAAASIGIGVYAVGVAIAVMPASQIDLVTYQAAVGRMLAGGSLYGVALGEAPFLYPPFAGLMLLPSVWLPAPAPAAINLVLHLAACVVLALVLLVATPARRRGRVDAVLVFSLCTLALLTSNPVVSGLYFGQVSLAVVTLMVVDQVVVAPRWRGLLTGIAGAIKLVPLIMIPHYLLTRQWRAAANSVAGFVVATALGFVIAPTDSLQYWSGRVPVPLVSGIFNKSWWGLLHDLGSADPSLWAVGVAAIGSAGLWRAGQHHRRGQGLAATLVLGVAASLMSPLTWVHHLVWWPLTGLYLLLAGNRWQRVLGGLMLAAAVIGSPLVAYVASIPPWLAALGDVFPVASAVIVFTGLPRQARQESAP